MDAISLLISIANLLATLALIGLIVRQSRQERDAERAERRHEADAGRLERQQQADRDHEPRRQHLDILRHDDGPA